VVTINGVGSYDDSTTVQSGTLKLGPSGDISQSSPINVLANASFDVTAVAGGITIGTGKVISNRGSISGDLSVAGQLQMQSTGAAGQPSVDGTVEVTNGGLVISAGNAFFDGPVSVEGGGVFKILANSVVDFDSFDLLAGGKYSFQLGPQTKALVDGRLALAGLLECDDLSGSTPAYGSLTFLFLNAGSDAVVGTFAGLPEGASVTFDDLEFVITYAANGDGGAVGNDVALVATPEPNVACVLAVGLGGIFMRRRRRA
jgi:hypothetical protein